MGDRLDDGYTQRDGWVWAFCCVDHYTAEGWASVARPGDGFASLEPVYDAVRDHFGVVDHDVARGVAMRHDWGPQYTSEGHFQVAVRWLGIVDSPAFAGEPPCNGCAERFIPDPQGAGDLSAGPWETIDELSGEVIASFVERYSTQWLIERHSHRTPREAYEAAKRAVAA